jgi:hypothetical protein
MAIHKSETVGACSKKASAGARFPLIDTGGWRIGPSRPLSRRLVLEFETALCPHGRALLELDAEDGDNNQVPTKTWLHLCAHALRHEWSCPECRLALLVYYACTPRAGKPLPELTEISPLRMVASSEMPD